MSFSVLRIKYLLVPVQFCQVRPLLLYGLNSTNPVPVGNMVSRAWGFGFRIKLLPERGNNFLSEWEERVKTMGMTDTFVMFLI